MNLANYKTNEHYMRRCLALAVRYYGQTEPNPVVGALVVRDGKIVGKGAHRKAGTEHAEVLAIRAAGELSKGATLYVTLEPCNHHGKTAPCTDAVIAAGIKKVVYGLKDPNPIASGGAEKLKANGIEVFGGVFSLQIEQALYPWIFQLKNKRKLIDLYAFTSIDGSLLEAMPKYSKAFLSLNLHSKEGRDIFNQAGFDRLIVVRLNSKYKSVPWPQVDLKLNLESVRQLGSKSIITYKCFQE